MMDTLTQTDREPATAPFLAGELGPGPAWLQSLREQARTRLGEIGFPTTEQEEWRFTNMAPLRGWSRKGDRLRRFAPQGHRQTMTYLRALR